MGRTHATSGAVAFLAALPVLTWADDSQGPVTVAVGALTAAGGAMLPDLDHPQATIARSLGPVTRLLSEVVARLSGGHRQGTHSIAGVAAFTLFTWLLTLAQDSDLGRLVLGLWLTLLFVVGSAVLHVPMPRPLRLGIGAAVALLLLSAAAQHAFRTDVVVWAVAIGSAAHIVGDLLTREGCPLLWPVSRRRQRLMTLKTSGWTERLVVGPGLALVALTLAIRQAGGGDSMWTALIGLVTP